MCALYGARRGKVSLYRLEVYERVRNVLNFAATHTNVVMMRLLIAIEAHRFLPRAKRADETKFCQ
jgi:hypothetical protein